MEDITIIGGGFSGAMLAVNMLKEKRPVHIRIVEKDSRIGYGLAFSAVKDYHLLNVPAHVMGAFPNDTKHFLKWLKHKNIDTTPFCHVPRKYYGAYINELFTEELKTCTSEQKIEIICDEAVNVSIKGTKAEIRLKSDDTFLTDKVVLALGHFPPGHPRSMDRSFIESDRYFRDPWSAPINNEFKSSDKILLIGSGLTMIDTVLTLHNNGFNGKIFSYSNHGYIPSVNKQSDFYPSIYHEIKEHNTILDIFKIVRKHIKIAEEKGIGWRAVLDSFRYQNQEIWLSLPLEEKKKFLKHLSRIWNIARHRIPGDYDQVLNKLVKSGQLEIKAVKILSMIKSENCIKVNYFDKKVKEEKTESFDYVLNCTGPQSNYERVECPLVINLLKQGYIKCDLFGMGLNALPNGTLIDKQGAPSGFLYSIGPPLKGILGESTAVPELRQQAHDLARLLLKLNF
jgi:uncharacterized NAD(P)/FAD-binding protein YdhS